MPPAHRAPRIHRAVAVDSGYNLHMPAGPDSPSAFMRRCPWKPQPLTHGGKAGKDAPENKHARRASTLQATKPCARREQDAIAGRNSKAGFSIVGYMPIFPLRQMMPPVRPGHLMWRAVTAAWDHPPGMGRKGAKAK